METDVIHSVTLEQNVIPPEAFQELYNKYSGAVRTLINSWSWASDSEWNLWNLEKKITTYQGKWPKRFGSLYYKKTGEKLSETVLAEMGEVISRYAKKAQSYHFEITKFVDWQPGAFAERGGTSCWFTPGSPGDFSRKGLSQDPRGYAVLFYETAAKGKAYSKKKGIGRCWAIQQPDYLVIFNAYGIGLSEIAGVLANHLGKSFKRVKIQSRGTQFNTGNKDNMLSSGAVASYDSIGTAYIIGDNFPEVEIINVGDFRFKDVTCKMCKTPQCSLDKDLTSTRHGVYCKECSKDLIQCAQCGEYITKELASLISYAGGAKRHFCVSCAGRAFKCERHGLVVGRGHKVFHTSRLYCETCWNAGDVVTCTGCGNTVDKFKAVKLKKSTLNLCIPCHKLTRKADLHE